MKSKLIFTFLIALGSAFAQDSLAVCDVFPNVKSVEVTPKVEQQHGYVSLGVGPLPVLLPAFSLGYRAQSGHHGADISAQVQTIVSYTQLKANLLYHYYFKPSLTSQFYVGGGVGPSCMFDHNRNEQTFLISPEVVLGKQYRNENNDLRFFQTQISFPTFAVNDVVHFRQNHHTKTSDKIFYFPSVIISYGLGF